MEPPPPEEPQVYIAIVGMSALLCFALLLTNSAWLTLAIMMIGCLHLARYFPHIEAFILTDPLLFWLRRLSPILILAIVGIVALGRWLDSAAP